MLNLPWFPQNSGFEVLIDPYDSNFPTATICVIDIETNGVEITDKNFKLVCIGITEFGDKTKVFFDLRPELFEYLKKTNLVGHNMKGAEIAWLAPHGVTIDNLYYDTKVSAYVFDSARKNQALKPLVKDLFGIEYPSYSDLVETEEFIQLACENNPELMIQSKSGPKYPKKVTLDKQDRDIVAAYNSMDCLVTYKLWKWLEANMSITQKNFYTQIELPTTKLLYKMEQRGVKIDIVAVRRIHNENSKARRLAKRQLFEIAGQSFNTNSPKQILPILQNSGVDVQSTGEDALVLHLQRPIVHTLLEYRKRQKICSTYTIPLYANAIRDRDHRIHAHFNQNTITGRLSSSDPINLQNQPPAVRECFVASEGNILVGGDLSNLEIRLPGHLSNEPGFVSELSKPNGGDLHTKTAIALFGSAVTSLPEAEFKAKRAKAKTCNFLLTNSGTPYGLANELHCSIEEAEELYTKFWEGYPIMAEWLKYEKKLARENGGVSSYFGRWVRLPQLSLWCGNPSCGKSKQRFSCKQCRQREEAESTAISIRVQGTGGDMVKLAALRLYRDYGYIPVLSIHDELVLDIPLDNKDEAMYNLKHTMESVVQLRVPLVSNIKVGHSWKDCH